MTNKEPLTDLPKVGSLIESRILGARAIVLSASYFPVKEMTTSQEWTTTMSYKVKVYYLYDPAWNFSNNPRWILDFRFQDWKEIEAG